MNLTRNRLLKIIIISSLAVPIIQLITAMSIQGIYGCTDLTAKCNAQLGSANVAVYIGIGLVYLALVTDALAILTLIYFLITKKK